jgi:hypothetical protein
MIKVRVGQIYEDKYMRAEVLTVDADTINCKIFYKQTQGTRQQNLHKSRLLEMKKIKG